MWWSSALGRRCAYLSFVMRSFPCSSSVLLCISRRGFPEIFIQIHHITSSPAPWKRFSTRFFGIIPLLLDLPNLATTHSITRSMHSSRVKILFDNPLPVLPSSCCKFFVFLSPIWGPFVRRGTSGAWFLSVSTSESAWARDVLPSSLFFVLESFLEDSCKNDLR